MSVRVTFVSCAINLPARISSVKLVCADYKVFWLGSFSFLPDLIRSVRDLANFGLASPSCVSLTGAVSGIISSAAAACLALGIIV